MKKYLLICIVFVGCHNQNADFNERLSHAAHCWQKQIDSLEYLITQSQRKQFCLTGLDLFDEHIKENGLETKQLHYLLIEADSINNVKIY